MAACSAGSKSEFGAGGETTTSHGGAAGAGAGGTGAGAQGAGGALLTGGTGGGTPIIEEVFGESADVLYKLDPVTNQVTAVGPFQGCSGVFDLAIDKDSKIYATTSDSLYRINESTAACTLVASGSYPNSLSFVPAGTLDPNEEALVGYLDADYVRIDKNTGVVSTIGSITGGYISSGDIVSVINGGTYLTVKGGSNPACADCIVEVSPVTGNIVKNYGDVGYSQVFGLAFWGGKAYGFTNGGKLFAITFGASSVSCTEIPIPGAPVNLSFWGAGSSTAVPLIPPS